jgi:hypothetical protein
MADAERVAVEKNSMPEELSAFDELILSDANRLYGIDEQGKRKPVTNLGHTALLLAAKASGTEIEVLAPAAAAGRRQERSQRTDDIEAIVQRLVEERISAVTRAHEQQTQELQAEIESLRAEIERLQKPLHERLDDAFGDNWVPREEGVAVGRRGNDGFMDDGWTTASQPYEKEGRWYIRVKKDNNEEEAELANLSRVPETPPPADEAAQRQQQREELETRIANYDGVNQDNLYQTYRGHLQNAANTDEREAFANDTARAAAMAQIRSQEVRDYINSMNEEQRNALPADAVRDLTAWLEVRDAQEPAITPAAETEDQSPAGIPDGSRPVYRRRGWFSRRWDQVRGRPAREYVATGVYAPPEGGYVRVVDDEVVEVPPSEVEGRDTTARVLGGLALIGVAALTVHELLEHKYLGHSPTREMRNNGVFPWGHSKGGLPNHAIPGREADGGHGLGNGTHTDFFNPTPGHRRTAMEGAQSIHLTGNPGDETVKDGNHVLLRHVQFTKEGLISKLDRMRLRNMGYHVEWGKLQDTAKGVFRYKSVVSK